MSGSELSGTQAGSGFGNKSDLSDPDLTEHHQNTRYGIQERYHGESGGADKAYLGGHESYRSGTVGGAGSGNKLDAAGADGPDLTEQHSSTRYDLHRDSQPYQGGGEFKSGTVGGPGFGNKTAGPKTDSTSGKLMQKVGGMMGKDDMVQQGTKKREERAAAAASG